MLIAADTGANAKRVSAWFLTVPGDNPNLPGHVREHNGLFASRAKCHAKAKYYEKMHGERFVCMKISTEKDAITNP